MPQYGLRYQLGSTGLAGESRCRTSRGVRRREGVARPTPKPRLSFPARRLKARYAIVRMGWAVETVSAVDAEIEALPVALRARLVRLLEAVENVGLETLCALHARHLENEIWEIRVRAEGDCQRDLRDGGRTAGVGSARLCDEVVQDAAPGARDRQGRGSWRHDETEAVEEAFDGDPEFREEYV